jgi:hypothetical protein
VTSAAKAGVGNEWVVAAVNRCATQKQMQRRYPTSNATTTFPQGVKGCPDTKQSIEMSKFELSKFRMECREAKS